MSPAAASATPDVSRDVTPGAGLATSRSLRDAGHRRLLASQSATVATGCASIVLALAVVLGVTLDRPRDVPQAWSLRGTLTPSSAAPPSDAGTVPPPAAAIDRARPNRDASDGATGLHRVSKTV